MNDAGLIVYGLKIGVPIGLVIFCLLELADPDSRMGEFWQAFKKESRE